MKEELIKEFFYLAGQWLEVRLLVIYDGVLPFGVDIAGCMLGMRDLELEMKEILKGK